MPNSADYSQYSYCIKSGFVLSKCTNRPLALTEDLCYVLRVHGRRVKIKASKLCWMLGNDQTISQGYSVLHRNLDETDNRLKNLIVLPAKTCRQVLEAEANLQGAMKISLHPTDHYAFVLQFRNNGKLVKEKFDCNLAAKRKLKRLQLKYAKILCKYCLMDS